MSRREQFSSADLKSSLSGFVLVISKIDLVHGKCRKLRSQIADKLMTTDIFELSDKMDHINIIPSETVVCKH